MRSVAAFSPCNVTGFFRIYDEPMDPVKVGSTGAAVSLALGVTTHVKVRKTQKRRIRATFNGRPLPRGSVSAFVAGNYMDLGRETWSVDISHRSRMPIGCGFGTSGAGALGLSLALNETIGSPLRRHEAAQLAHVADVVCRTGLGTVSSVYHGGLTVRMVPGAPGIGQVKTIRLPASLRIVAGSFGPISTKRVLGSGRLKRRVNKCSERLLGKLYRSYSGSSFMRISRVFADCLGLMSNRLEHLVKNLDSIGHKSSMAMLGETAFCLVSEDEIAQPAALIRRINLTPIVSPIARSGAHLL
ncbi:hypothetical protein J2P12_02290 [Candidatus Bathyarchaeota archaeon]|nr:hypothetical protein [Candidatus Bathyarchaeota archaeon]